MISSKKYLIILLLIGHTVASKNDDNGIKQFKTWSLEFLDLLDANQDRSGVSLEDQVQPVWTFIKDLQQNPDFIPWLEYFTQKLMESPDANLDNLINNSKSSLDVIIGLVQHLLNDDTIGKTYELITKKEELKNPLKVSMSYLTKKPVTEYQLNRFRKKLYNAKRRQMTWLNSNRNMPKTILTQAESSINSENVESTTRPTVSSPVEGQKDLVLNVFGSPEKFQAFIKMAAELFQVGSLSPTSTTTSTISSTLLDKPQKMNDEPVLQAPEANVSSELNKKAVDELQSQSNGNTTQSNKSTTTFTTDDLQNTTPGPIPEYTTVILSWEDFTKKPRNGKLVKEFVHTDNISNDLEEITSTTLASIESRLAAAFPNLNKKTTEKSSVSERESSTTTTTTTTGTTTTRSSTTTTKNPTTRSPPYKPNRNIWTESDIKVCEATKSCMFIGKIVVSGFETYRSEQWEKVNKDIMKTLEKGLTQIFADSFIGESYEKSKITNIDQISYYSAEVVFEVLLKNSFLSVDTIDFANILDQADDDYFFPYKLDRSLTEFELSRPDITKPNASQLLSGNSSPNSSVVITPLVLASIMASLLLGCPLIAWLIVAMRRRIKARSLKRMMRDTSPLIYSELEAAISSMHINNLYSSAGFKKQNKKSKSRSTIFDVEREKEKLYQSMRAEAALYDEFLISNERPLPPVPHKPVAARAHSSPNSDSLKPRSGKFTLESSSWFSGMQTEDISPITSIDEYLSPRLSRRKSSFKRLAHNFRMKRDRVRLRESSRPTIDGIFNAAFLTDEVNLNNSQATDDTHEYAIIGRQGRSADQDTVYSSLRGVKFETSTETIFL